MCTHAINVHPRHKRAPTPYRKRGHKSFRPRGIPGYQVVPHHITSFPTPYTLIPTPYTLLPTSYTHAICMLPTLYKHVQNLPEFRSSDFACDCRLAPMLWQNAGRYARVRVNDAAQEDVHVDHNETSTSTSNDTEHSVGEWSAGEEMHSDEEDDQDLASPPADILAITRRQGTYGTPGVPVAHLPPLGINEYGNPRNIFALQKLWHEHCSRASKLYPKSLWRIVNAVKLESKVTQTKVLRACKPLLAHSAVKSWPLSRQQIDAKLARKLGRFFPRVTRVIKVDLTHYGVHKPIRFTFIDPVFAWAQCAKELVRLGHKLYFKFHPLYDPTTGQRLFGASVAHGELMRKACAKCPHGDGPALIGVSYDSGQASRRRSYTPILVTVGNTDYCGLEACYCIAYMPILPKYVLKKHVQNAVHELTQTCIGAIFEVVESCAKEGFECALQKNG